MSVWLDDFEGKYVFLRLSTDEMQRKVMLKDASIINEGNSTTIDINLEPEQVEGLLGKLDYDQQAKDTIGTLEISLEDTKFALKIEEASANELSDALMRSDNELLKYKKLNEVNQRVINSNKLHAYTLEESVTELNALMSEGELWWE